MALTAVKVTQQAGAVHRFSLKDYNRMIEAGILSKYDKVELMRGEIVNMAPMGNKHQFLTNDLAERLLEVYKGVAWTISQSSVQLLADSEPEPDLTVLKLPKAQYLERKPQAEDVLLITEVSDSTLAYDRSRKLGLYAEANIPEVWLRNVQDEVLEVYREPGGGRYGRHLTLSPGEVVTPLFSETPFDWSGH